jgi:prepilin-type N-terminal cleavage/methylation domain-containing protein
MHYLARRGFTLVELMIALVLLGIVSAAVYQVLISDQRIYQAQTQRIDLQQNIRAAATILPAEFRVLNASDGDILAMSSDSIRIRAMRAFGIICSAPVLGVVPPNGRLFTLRNSMTFGSRSLAIGDSVLVYYEGAVSNRNDDGWIRGRVTLVTPAVGCTGDLRPGTQITTDLVAADFNAPLRTNTNGNIPSGAPVWGYEIDTYKLYQAPDNKWYLGVRDQNNVIQPLVGPLIGNNGLTLSYYDAAGVVTAVPTSVAQIEIKVRGRTAQPVRQADGTQAPQVDSILARVALRNNKRW